MSTTDGTSIAAGDHRVDTDRRECGGIDVTLIWFVVWLVFDLVGDRESLTFDPPNWWAGTLLLAAALDLGRQHASPLGRNR